jgi:hypothetical protein
MFASLDNKNQCNQYMKPIEDIYNVGRIYVGHTPQIEKGINSICNDRVWLADVGVSKAFDMFETPEIKQNGSRNAQVLEILQDGKQINILK